MVVQKLKQCIPDLYSVVTLQTFPVLFLQFSNGPFWKLVIRNVLLHMLLAMNLINDTQTSNNFTLTYTVHNSMDLRISPKRSNNYLHWSMKSAKLRKTTPGISIPFIQFKAKYIPCSSNHLYTHPNRPPTCPHLPHPPRHFAHCTMYGTKWQASITKLWYKPSFVWVLVIRMNFFFGPTYRHG